MTAEGPAARLPELTYPCKIGKAMNRIHPRVDPLAVPEATLGEGSPISLVRVPTPEAVIDRFA